MVKSKLVALLTPKRRWLQFRLRTVFVLVAVAAVPCCWLKWKVDQKRQERDAVGAIQRLGGTAWYQWEFDDLKATHPPGPAWLRRLFGDNLFSHVNFVYLDRSSDPDSAMSHLKGMNQLSGLSLTNSRITDNGLSSVERLSSLHELYLDNTFITDSGVKHLKTLTSLTYLGIHGTKTTSAAADDLRKALPGCVIVGP